MNKIGIIRGLMPRLPQVEFASSFSSHKPIFITGGAELELIQFAKDKKIEIRNLPLKNIYWLDPVSVMLGRLRHQSWVGVDGLTHAVSGISLIETYELYHFFSRQAAETAKIRRIPLIVEVWTSFLHPAYFFPPYSFNARKVAKSASLFIARSKLAKKALVKYGIPEEKIKVIYHGINIKRFKPLENKKTAQNVLFVGQLESYKGVDMLINIWPNIIKRFPDAKLTLIGKGSLYDKAKKTRNIYLPGLIPNNKLHKYYQKADLFISPSQNRYLGPFLWWEEFFSYVLMEAQACGLPVIATNSGGITEEIDSRNWIIPQKNQSALYKALCDALSDTKSRQRLSKINRVRATRYFDLVTQTKKLEKEIKIILKEYGTA